MGGGVSSDYVDLGLPSKLLWAKKNLGAETEEDAGLYFQWGDTQGYTAEQVGVDKQFTLDDYKFSIDGSGSNFSKYNSTDGKTVLDLEDDAVRVAMGGNWRIPTNEDFQELINNTDLYLVTINAQEIKGNIETENIPSYATIYIKWEKETTDLIKGVRFYKKNDRSVQMFIPAVGGAYVQSVEDVNKGCYLWSSSISQQYIAGGLILGFESNDGGVYNSNRNNGFNIRGVTQRR